MTVNQVCIIDWYDGVITALSEINEKHYISVCISRDFTNDENLYYNVEINKDSFLELQDKVENEQLYTKQGWKEISLIFNQNNTKENVFLFKAGSFQIGLNVDAYNPEIFEIKKLKFPYDIGSLYV